MEDNPGWSRAKAKRHYEKEYEQIIKEALKN